MEEQQLKQIMYASVKMTCDQLADIELAMLNNFAQLGMNPKGQPWYSKVDGLFTESGGTKAHGEILDALAWVVNQRLA
jgi:hypothetical protein